MGNYSNPPFWALSPEGKALKSFPSQGQGFYEIWHFNTQDPAKNRALSLQFTLLSTNNGFRRIAEIWAIFSQQGAQGETTKIALKQTNELDGFLALPGQISIGDSHLMEKNGTVTTRGSLNSKSNTISWDLVAQDRSSVQYGLLPDSLRKWRLMHHTLATIHGDLAVSGKLTINGEEFSWEGASGYQSHEYGKKRPHSWIWSQCNSFTDEQGKAVPFTFEGYSGNSRFLGPLKGPRLSLLHFTYQGQSYAFDSLKDSLAIRSSHTLNHWKFEAERRELLFRGVTSADHKNFAGLSYEDTNGSLIYCANSDLARIKVHVYRRGKLETTLVSQTAAFAVADREKNPYVPILL